MEMKEPREIGYKIQMPTWKLRLVVATEGMLNRGCTNLS